ncbi:hypothetical protein LY76DRAFT_655532 [Colletotrichum caudatum]|nr:hypothetical protein LY76DRAFT_655532 [Colletotrichum caudatum]
MRDQRFSFWQSGALETALGLGLEVRVAQLSGARAARPRGAMFPLSLDYSEQEDGGLEVHIEYNQGLVPAAAADALVTLVPRAVESLACRQAPLDVCDAGTS